MRAASLGLLCLAIVGAVLPARADEPLAAPTAEASAVTTAALVEAPSVAPIAEDLLAIPRGSGLPVLVRVAVYVEDVDAVDDDEGSFTATLDVRMIWKDVRLRYPAAETPIGFQQFAAEAAEAKIQTIWTPDVALENLIDEPTYEVRGLRIRPDGEVEMMRRVTARFATELDFHSFPFDRQRLSVELASLRDPSELVTLDFRQEDLDFCRISGDVELDGWELGVVDMVRRPQIGWHGALHSRVFATLGAARDPWSAIVKIFVPLFASLLIPLLALWLNSVEDGSFKIEAFELANVLIGGLFAVIALNFTVNSEYPSLVGDNPVSRLFGLNYLLLAVSIAINVGLMRFGVLKRAYGRFVQEEAFMVLFWVVPALVLTSAVTILVLAMA